MRDREKLVDVIKALKIQIHSVRIAKRPDGGNDDKAPNRAHFAVFLRRRMGKTAMTDKDWLPFGFYSCHIDPTLPKGSPHSLPNGPAVADVLYCLASDAGGADQAFGPWSEDLGYEKRTHKEWKQVRKIWKACRRTRKLLAEFLGEHFDRVLNAEH